MVATLTQYRQRFAQDLRAFKPDGGGTSGTGTTATLVDPTWPIQQNLERSAEFDNWYILRPAAVNAGDLVRQVNPGLYAPRTGTFTVDRPYTAAPSAEAYELHGHGFDPSNALNQLLNAALKDIHVVAIIPYAPRVSTSGTYTQNLTNGDGSSAVNVKIANLLHPRWVHAIDLIPAAQTQVQTITITGTPTTGTWTFTYQGVTGGAIAVGAVAATLQTALRLIPGLEAVTVSTGATSTPNFVYTITMTGAPQESPLLQVTDGTSGGSHAIAVAVVTEMGIPVPQAGRVGMNGPYVVFDAKRHYEAGDTLYITCELPAYYWCRSATTAAWGGISGLSLEAHQAQPHVEWVSAGMQVWAWRRRPDLMIQGVDQRQVASQATAQAEFDRYKMEFLAGVETSELLTFPVEGGDVSSSSPVASLARDVAPATPGR
jgi:hypothetical protein